MFIKYFLTSIICLEHPLLKYQSSLDEALRDVWAIRLVSKTLGFHSFLVLIITLFSIVVCNNEALYDHIYHNNDISKARTWL